MGPDVVARRPERAQLLQSYGAAPALLDELLAYNERPFERQGGLGPGALPLDDEPHISAWSEYVGHAQAVGVLPALRERFPQLRFPIREGISKDEQYRRATLRGTSPGPLDEQPPNLELNDPAGLKLSLNPTVAGRVPILVVPDRADFVALVQAFTCRNEPERVPDSMGACIVSGLNNWDRIARHRHAWEMEHAEEEGASWDEEFQRIIPKKELYQDRFIILSTGTYSFVPASEAGMEEGEWRRLSLVIRREHECTHYLTYRVIGSMKNNLQDEVIADAVGLIHAFGRYDGNLALRFFGLERYPEYREGARLQAYLGQPRLSDPAVVVVRTLVQKTVKNLEAFCRAWDERLEGNTAVSRLALALSDLTLEELASGRMLGLLEAQLSSVEADLPAVRPSVGTGDSVWIDIGQSDDGMSRMLERFNSFADGHPRLAGVKGNIAMALDEIVSNVINHGFDEKVCHAAGEHEHLVLVGVTVRPLELEVQIIDDAKCFSILDDIAPPDLSNSIEDRPIGGLGVHLVKQLMDQMEYRRYAGRNHLILKKNLPE